MPSVHKLWLDDRLRTKLIDLGHGSSLNTTARSLVRIAHDETALFNNISSGELDVLLDMINENVQLPFYCLRSLLSGFIAHIHDLNTAAVLVQGQSIKISLQQMKYDINNKSSAIYSSINMLEQKLSMTTEPSSVLRDDKHCKKNFN